MDKQLSNQHFNQHYTQQYIHPDTKHYSKRAFGRKSLTKMGKFRFIITFILIL